MPTATTKKTTAKSPSKKAPSKKSPSKKSPSKKAPSKKAPSKKAPSKVVSATKASATKASVTKASVTKASVTKTPATKSAAKKVPVTKPVAKTAPMPSLVAVGAKAPAFTASDPKGKPVSLAALAGKPIVLYFYPKDDTPGCTVEACSFRDAWARFRKAGADVLGVSPDGAASHAGFIGKLRLPFALLADEPVGKRPPAVCAAYGTWVEKSMYGKKYWGAQRATFILDSGGKVVHVIPKVSPKKHDEQVLEALAGL